MGCAHIHAGLTGKREETMTIQYHIDQDGSFTAGDVDSGVTAYAYPSSEHAQQAKRNPLKVAEEMIQGEMRWSRRKPSVCGV